MAPIENQPKTAIYDVACAQLGCSMWGHILSQLVQRLDPLLWDQIRSTVVYDRLWEVLAVGARKPIFQFSIERDEGLARGG